MHKRSTYTYDLRPSDYSADQAAVYFEQEVHGLPAVFSKLPILRGRNRWMAAMPACVLRPDALALTNDEEAKLIDAALEARRTRPLGLFKPTRDAILREGRRFYASVFLDELGPFLALPATAAAVAAFLRAAAAQPGLIRAPVTEAQSPNREGSGTSRRWEPWEDAVLRNWFGVRSFGENQGRHVPLTEREWAIVLDEHLKGRRTKAQVKVRVTTLNRELRVSLLVDGFLPRDKVREFQERALGEQRVRVPRFRPRIKGRSYRGDHERPVLGQPD
jgi:hypothetical protein